MCTASECSQVLADMFSIELGSPAEHSAEVSGSVGPLSGFVMERCSDSSLSAKEATGKQMETPQLSKTSSSRQTNSDLWDDGVLTSMLCQLFLFPQGVFCWDDISVGDWWSYGGEPPFLLLIWCWRTTFWCFPKVRVMKLFLSACDGPAAVSCEDGVAGCLEWPLLPPLEAFFCSHNTQLQADPVEESPVAYWEKIAESQVDRRWAMGLATLLHRLIPRLPKTLSPIHSTQHASQRRIS